MSSQMCACPVMRSTPIAVRTVVLARSEPIITSRRGRRSPTTPPIASVETCANVQAANESPTSVALPPRSSTPNDTAIGARYVPTYDTARPAKSSRKFVSRSGFTSGPLPERPGVPMVRLHPRADAAFVTGAERFACVAEGEAVDVAQVGVLLDRDDASEQAHVVVPALCSENGERDARIAAHVLEALARVLHVQEDAAVLPVVPCRRRVRRAVGTDRRDDGRVRLGEECVDLGRDRNPRHQAAAFSAQRARPRYDCHSGMARS